MWGSARLQVIAPWIRLMNTNPPLGPPPMVPDAAKVQFNWGVQIPLRDGVYLSATVYRPREQKMPALCIFTLTPYIAQSHHQGDVFCRSASPPGRSLDR